ncbi:hybrid sensor histidine kinase/response regulator [Pedosphaera parvula]|uniref:histidine kinase n=1 Tax=Pedosphaera parvula (strain Ellin514) TaxID=320771 RepID=B9XKH9_PEDPL|nr:PAS domain-containing protein [Pedosphaera parvula]EEF59649.1 multi-sensor hybrid histidine kinase [Pedosphaera parvula Ellin514]
MNLLSLESSDHKQWEKELQRVNRALRLVCETNKTLAQSSDVGTWLDRVCRTAVEVGGYRMAWVGFAEQNERRSVRPVACAGFESGYLESANITWADEPRGRGPVGTSIRTGEFCVTRNIPEDPAFHPWREQAVLRGYNSSIALPLRNNGRVFGTLSMYAEEVDAFESKEVEILKQLAEDLAFGLTVVLRTRAERRSAMEALEESQRKLEQAQRIAHVGHWERDLKTGLITCSDEIYRILGLEPQPGKLYRSEFLKLVHPEDRDRLVAEVDEATRLSQHFDVEYRIIRPDGGVRFLHSQGSVMRGDTKKSDRVFGIAQDITQRKRAIEALMESEQRFRQVTESIDEVFWLTNLDRNETIYISPAYERIWGRTCESLYKSPQSWLEAVHPEDQARVKEAFQKFQKTGSFEQEFRILRPDGVQRWIHDRGFPVRDKQGNLYRLAGVAEDITERKELEKQFLRAQRMESIGTLAGGIAHDLNNMLAPILMTCELMKMELPGEENQQLIAMIEGNAKRGSELVKQVLSFARGVEGCYLSLQPRHLIREIASIIGETFPKSIRIQTRIAENLWPLSGDPTQLHQVMLNLSLNARDAMPSGGDLTITAENIEIDAANRPMNLQAKPGSYVVIKVTDTGTGIAPEMREKIFDPFFTTKEVGEGTGLGLSTALGIVKSHSGFINVYSEPGKGSTFEVWLPAKVARDLAASGIEEARMPHGRGELLLVIDDEASVRTITKQTLEAYGYNVLTAADGADAVAVFAQHKDEIKLALTDMIMPVMDGSVLIPVLKKINPAVEIIAVSGLSTSEHRARAMATGAKHFLPKPYTAETLLNTLDEMLHTGAKTREDVPVEVD